MLTSRQRGQALVEFGLVAVLFTLLAFSVVDLGLLLTTWLNTSTGVRDLARSSALGTSITDLRTAAADPKQLLLPSLDPNFPGGRSAAIDVGVSVYDLTSSQNTCFPSAPGCQPMPKGDPNLSKDYDGSCAGPPGTNGCHPLPGDMVVVKLTVKGAQVISPLVRNRAWGCTDPCWVPLASTAMMRYEGKP
jgi:TadE-like protein